MTRKHGGEGEGTWLLNSAQPCHPCPLAGSTQLFLPAAHLGPLHYLKKQNYTFILTCFSNPAPPVILTWETEHVGLDPSSGTYQLEHWAVTGPVPTSLSTFLKSG